MFISTTVATFPTASTVLCIHRTVIRTGLSVTNSVTTAYHRWVHVFFEVRAAEAAIPVISDMAAVHDLTEQVAQILPRHLRVGLKVVVQDVDADGEVAHVERIASIPALRAELASLADNCVKVAESKQDALEFRFACAHLQRILVYNTPTNTTVNI